MTIGATNPVHIYLDESGDLGWTFTAPYRRGGSSRYLTIVGICVPPSKSHLLARAIKQMGVKYNWTSKKERKFVHLSSLQRLEFAEIAESLCAAHPDILMHAIVAKKEKVAQHIRVDGNKLYNYMIKLSLIKEMAKHDVATLIHDERTIKVESGNSLFDYLQTELWFTEKAVTSLACRPQDSAHDRSVQFADFIAGIVQARYEDNELAPFNALATPLKLNHLFF